MVGWNMVVSTGFFIKPTVFGGMIPTRAGGCTRRGGDGGGKMNNRPVRPGYTRMGVIIPATLMAQSYRRIWVKDRARLSAAPAPSKGISHPLADSDILEAMEEVMGSAMVRGGADPGVTRLEIDDVKNVWNTWRAIDSFARFKLA